MIDTDAFIQELILKAIPDVEKEELDAMIEETQPVLYDRVITHIISQIDEKSGQKFIDILETEGVTPEVAEYLKNKIPNFQKFLEKTYEEFEVMYLKEFKSFEKENQDENTIDS